METKANGWYAARGSSGQGLVIEEGTGRNVAVTYEEKDAPLAAAAPEMAELLAEMAEDDRVPCEYAEEMDALLAKIKGDDHV